MFLGINIFWALLRAHFNPRLTARAKMSLSRAQNIFIIWPVRPRARFHCKAIEKIPVWGPYTMARAGPE